MKLLSSAHKTAQRFLNSQQYHLNGGFSRQFFHASNPIGCLKPNEKQSSLLYFGRYCSTSGILDATHSSRRCLDSNKIVHNVKKADLEIISRETIKPSSPTPQHLRIFDLCIIDQFIYDVYTPMIVFFPNTDKASVEKIVTKRLKHLKETLSETLTRFYPFAGKVKDNLQIDCNDEGIIYSQAQVSETLQDFLGHPEDERVRGLLPESPCTAESSIGNYIIGIQVNIFKCGGIGLSVSASHKIVDGHTYYFFLKAWAAAARSSTIVSPSFVASNIFPNNPSLEYSLSSKLLATKMLCTKRFVFDSMALALLKAKPVPNTISKHPPTRVQATTAVIWKAAAQAAAKIRPFGPQSPHALLSIVNLRNRASPPLPKESIGNLIDVAGAICFPAGQLDLPTMMGEVRESISKITSNKIESMKGENGQEAFNDILRAFKQVTDITAVGDCMMTTSLLNSGMYELDFGWGKPIWFYHMNSGLVRFLCLNETINGGGVEAIVTLSPEEMEIFERDPELLSYATIDPSPLQFVY